MPRPFSRIAIVKLSSIGDIVHTLPALHTLRLNYPKAYIAWIVDDRFEELLQGHPELDEVIAVPLRRWRKDFFRYGLYPAALLEIFWFGQDLRRRLFDLALDFQGLIKSGLVTKMTGASTRVGFAFTRCKESLNYFFTDEHALPEEEDRHVVEKNLSLLKVLGIESSEVRFPLAVDEAHKDYAQKFWASLNTGGGQPWVAFNPGAGWPTKRWPVQYWAALGDLMMAEDFCRVLLCWGPGEKHLVETISQLMLHKPVILPATGLKQFLAVLERVNLFISGDTGPLHLAAAAGKKVLGIYGPSDPWRNGPYGEGHRIITAGMDCQPCWQRACDSLFCMDKIAPEEVLAVVKDML